MIYDHAILEDLISVSKDIVKTHFNNNIHRVDRALDKAKIKIVNAFLYIQAETSEVTNNNLFVDDFSRGSVTLQISRFYIETALIWELNFSYGEVLEFEHLLRQQIYVVEVPEE